jgi:hypothetical protein
VPRNKAARGNRRKMKRGKLDNHQRLPIFGRPNAFSGDSDMEVELGEESVDWAILLYRDKSMI